jgi:hypothetical protein
MVEIANVPLHDEFQVVTRHAADEIIYPKEGYLGLTYTSDLILNSDHPGCRSFYGSKKRSFSSG